jgi:hypothetical protein
MPTIKIARYAVVPGSDANTLIPNNLGINDAHFQGIQAPNVDPQSRSIFFFKMEVKEGSLTLQIRLNTTIIVRRDFVPGNACSFHEIVAAGVLKEDLNELTVFVSGDGKVVFSDAVLLYEANTDAGSTLPAAEEGTNA